MNYNSISERFKKGSILVREVRFLSLTNLKTYSSVQGRFIIAYFRTIRGVWGIWRTCKSADIFSRPEATPQLIHRIKRSELWFG